MLTLQEVKLLVKGKALISPVLMTEACTVFGMGLISLHFYSASFDHFLHLVVFLKESCVENVLFYFYKSTLTQEVSLLTYE